MTRMTDKNLGDACRNPDGKTYDARKLAQWLFEATTGKAMSDQDAQQLVDDAAAKAKQRKSLANSGDEPPPPSTEQTKPPD